MVVGHGDGHCVARSITTSHRRTSRAVIAGRRQIKAGCGAPAARGRGQLTCDAVRVSRRANALPVLRAARRVRRSSRARRRGVSAALLVGSALLPPAGRLNGCCDRRCRGGTSDAPRACAAGGASAAARADSLLGAGLGALLRSCNCQGTWSSRKCAALPEAWSSRKCAARPGARSNPTY